MASRDCQDGGIVFGNWKLLPVDEHNWELCHRHETRDTASARKAGTAGVMRWNRVGRYYQYNTFGNAIRYAADVELKEGHRGRAVELMDAVHEYERILDEFLSEVSEALKQNA